MNRSEVESLFPYPYRETYYNSAGETLNPIPVRREVKEFLDAFGEDKVGVYPQVGQKLARLRNNLAELMNALPEEVAVTHHTAEGASVIANGLDWKAGDKILTLDREYPSTLYPWMNLERRRGVRLIFLEERAGRVPESEIVEAILRERPRLFAISAVEWCTGYRIDLEPIGRACRETGTFFFVDSAQALGFTEIDVRAAGVSAMAGSAWKWLFGPPGQGYLFLRRDLLDEIAPVFVGSDCVVNHLDYLDYDFTLLPDMRRFEYSSTNPAAIVWFDAGVRFVGDLGQAQARAHVFDLQDYAIEKLRDLDCRIRCAASRDRRSGIMGFRHPRISSADLAKRLSREANIIAQERDGFVRLSFHLYNTTEGIDRLVEFLRDVRSPRSTPA